MPLEAGYAQQIITPALDQPVFLAGFGLNRLAETVHDDLYVRALAFKDSNLPLVMASLDLLGFSRLHCLEIERRVNLRSPGARLILACTHTHHGPDTIGFWGPDRLNSGVDARYIDWLKTQVIETCIRALANLQPVTFFAASANVGGVAKNARDPLIVDDELTCLYFIPVDPVKDELISLLIFPCHPEVLWEDNPHISSDYPGYLRKEVEAAIGGHCLFFSGALGGMMTPDVQDHSFTEAEAIGKTLAAAAFHLYSTRLTVGPSPFASLYYRKQDFEIPLTNPLFQLAMGAGILHAGLDDQGNVSTEANLVQIGSTWLATVPGELLPKIGLDIKSMLRLHGAEIAAVVGLANDELGYILPQEDFIFPHDPFDPGAHYEETMSIGPQAGPNLISAISSLLSAG